jgi:uncharacterized repeat protein (TIGR03809 family)
MTHRLDAARGRDLVARWCAFAERRLDYLTELFETGRWRRYHTEQAFLENIREAKAAVEIWRKLSTLEASRDNSAVDFAWLGRSKATRAMQPNGEILRDDVRRPPPQLRISAELQPKAASITARPDRAGSVEAPSAPVVHAVTTDHVPTADPVPNKVSELTLDMGVLAQRYPLLRNAV